MAQPPWAAPPNTRYPDAHPTSVRPKESKAVRIRNPAELPPPPTAASAIPKAMKATQAYLRHVSSYPAGRNDTRTAKCDSPDSSEGEGGVVLAPSTKHAFDIYAPPFVPQVFSIINEQYGHVIDTPITKTIDFVGYHTGHFPWMYLPPIPAPIVPPPDPSPQCYSIADNVVDQQYQNYFRFHLESEIRSQMKENRSVSLFKHSIQYMSQHNDEIICSLIVPGLQENSPYIEEDDTIQLRQLFCDNSGGLLGMEQWLAGGKWRGQPAPGWAGVIYNARVVALQRKQKRLIIRVKGLFPNLAQRVVYFNVQFPLPDDRYLAMRQVLPIVQESLAAIDTYPWIRSMLFPIQADCELQTTLNPGFSNRVYFDNVLNWEQKKSVESVCTRNYGTLPFLISGPPGTGKTKTLIEVAIQLLKSVEGVSHVLFCAPSDPAADTIVQRISAHFTQSDLFRLNRPSRTFAEVPDAVLRFCCINNDRFDLPPLQQLMKFKLVVTTCRDAALLLYARLTNRDIYAAESGFHSTFHPSETHIPTHLHWTALLIDEAAQAMEPEALIPLSIVASPLENGKIKSQPILVMAGDEYQLGPRTSLPSTPLKTSLFARLFSRPVYANHPLARSKTGITPPPLNKDMLPISRPPFANLIRNYRSHPAILAVPSALYYNDTLEPEATDVDRLASWSGWRGKKWPVLFRENTGEDELEQDGGGWYNKEEAKIACSYAQDLVNSGLVAQNEVCIMAPFKAQVQCLRQTIRSKPYESLWSVDIGPVEAFQGLERGVVILCTTRSKHRFLERDRSVHWGIIGLPNKMNVALTRAKFGLILIGRGEILRQDSDWSQYLDYCERNGLVDDREWPRLNGEAAKLGVPIRLEKVLLARERSIEHHRALRSSGMDGEMCENDGESDAEVEIEDDYELSDGDANGDWH